MVSTCEASGAVDVSVGAAVTVTVTGAGVGATVGWPEQPAAPNAASNNQNTLTGRIITPSPHRNWLNQC
jgi:hypothetical protein